MNQIYLETLDSCSLESHRENNDFVLCLPSITFAAIFNFSPSWDCSQGRHQEFSQCRLIWCTLLRLDCFDRQVFFPSNFYIYTLTHFEFYITVFQICNFNKIQFLKKLSGFFVLFRCHCPNAFQSNRVSSKFNGQ